MASSIVQIGGDQGLLAQPVGHDHLKIVQAERFDVIAELLVHFDSFKGRYVSHRHNLEHEDMMMMGNFQAT